MERPLSLRLYLARSRQGSQKSQQGNGYPERPDGPLVWFHTETPEEMQMVVHLGGRLRMQRDWVTFLITFPPGVAQPRRLPDGIILCATPPDTGAATGAFLDHWRPTICVWTEGYLRPGLLAELRGRQIPHVLVDARTAALEPGNWGWLPGLAKGALQGFMRILATSQPSAQRARKLGAPSWRVEVTGPLQEGLGTPGHDETERSRWAEDLAARPLWLAARTDPEEEPIILEAHREARKLAHRLLLIIVPEDAERGAVLAMAAEDEGFAVARRSKNQPMTEATDVYVADTYGEMGLWYRIAPISFMGGSMGPGGARDPGEPAALGSAILHGPSTGRHRAAYERLSSAGAARRVTNVQGLIRSIGTLLSPDKAAEMAHAAWEVSTRAAAVTERVQGLVFDALDEAEDT